MSQLRQSKRAAPLWTEGMLGFGVCCPLTCTMQARSRCSYAVLLSSGSGDAAPAVPLAVGAAAVWPGLAGGVGTAVGADSAVCSDCSLSTSSIHHQQKACGSN